jgi:hypothetical protein
MSAPNLTLSAATKAALLAKLAAIDITVPLVTEGRRKEHREQFMMARFLATKAGASELLFPLDLTHSDGPDFILRFGSSEVGVECVEAVPQELYEIEILRENEFPGAMNFGQKFKPGERSFNREEKRQIASGARAGPPWMPEAAKRNWIAAMKHFIAGKAAKLRKGNYSSLQTMWLLVQDEWPSSIQYYADQQLAATQQLAADLAAEKHQQSFASIFIASGANLLSVAGENVRTQPIHDIWQATPGALARTLNHTFLRFTKTV